MRDGRSLISRPEAGPSGRSMTTALTAATAQAEAVRSHEEEAQALQDYVKRRIELFDQYKNREVEAVSAIFLLPLTPLITLPAPISTPARRK